MKPHKKDSIKKSTEKFYENIRIFPLKFQCLHSSNEIIALRSFIIHYHKFYHSLLNFIIVYLEQQNGESNEIFKEHQTREIH